MRLGRVPRAATGLVGLMALVAAAGCRQQTEAPDAPLTRVRGLTVELAEYSPRVSLTGEVRARDQSDVSFRVSGRITERNVDVGDHVIADQVLAKIDPAEQEANVSAALASVRAAEALLHQTKATYDRQVSLLDRGFTTRADFEQAQAAWRSAQNSLEAANADLDAAHELRADTVLTSRVNGVVTARSVEIGQVVQAAEPVFTIAQDGPRDAVFEVHEVVLSETPASRGVVALSLVADPTVTATGTVREVAPIVDPASGTVRVKVAIENTAARDDPGIGDCGLGLRGPAPARRAALGGADRRGRPSRGLGRGPGDRHRGAAADRGRELRRRNARRARGAGAGRNRRGGRGAAASAGPEGRAGRGPRAMTAGRGALALLAVALALTACRDEKAAGPPPVRPVLSMVVEPQTRGRQAFTGVVEPQFQAGLGFRLLGRVVDRDVDVGDSVRRGDRLAALDPIAQELAVRSARAELESALAQLETATATEVRQRTLFERKVVSSADVEAAEQAREAAVATAAQARANLKVAEEQLGYTRILADFDGVVTAVGAEVGQVVSPGETVVTVARPDRREAVIDIPAELVGLLRTGSRFEVALELDPAVRAEGAVREIAPQADPVSRTQRVWIALKDPAPSFRLGTTVKAVLTEEELVGMVLPASALLERDGKTLVWVVDSAAGTVTPVEVKVAERDARGFRVEGLDPGTRVVTAGVHSLEPGQAVRLAEGTAL